MSEEAVSASEQEIVKSILSQAETEAAAALNNARTSAEAEREQGRREAEQIEGELLARAEEKVQRIRGMETASAHVEAKRLLLQAREEAVMSVLDEVARKLSQLRKDTGRYKPLLSNLAVEAVRGVGAQHVILRVAESDKAVADSSFIEGVKQRVAAATERQPTIELEFSEKDLGGGCVARSTDGHILFDNTLPGRLGRARHNLRTRIVAELTKYHE